MLPNKNLKRIGSIPMVLLSSEANIKIGKMNDTFDPNKCSLTKEQNSKNYKLIEKKSNKEEIKFTGSLLAEQTSKYFIFRYNSETKRVEVLPADEWYTFKKEVSYPTLSLEEAEEKLKNRTNMLDLLKGKGGGTTGKSKKPKIEKEEREGGGGNAIRAGVNNLATGLLNDDDEDVQDELKPFLKGKHNEQSEEERDEDLDPELREIPSDIEDAFLGKTNNKDAENKNLGENSEVESASDDSLFGNENEESDVEDDDLGSSEVDKEDLDNEKYIVNASNQNSKSTGYIVENANTKEHDFLGTKRKGEEGSMNNLQNKNNKKQKVNASPIEELLNNLLVKNKRLTHDQIAKELVKAGFSQNSVNIQLPHLLSKMCNKFQQDGEFYYFRKSENI